LLVEDHRLVAECLQRLLQDSFEVVDWVQDAGTAIARSNLQVPDIIVMSISASGFSWLNTLYCLVRGIPSAKVLLVAAEESPTHLKAAFGEGARGYVSMSSPVNELLAAIRTVLAGGTYIALLIAARTDIRRVRGIHQLTRRQATIMELIVAGKTAKEIAALLQISAKTVEYHRTALFHNLGLRNTFELIRFAHTGAPTVWGKPSTVARGASAPRG
jgi:DNA-binding NarL/FixJ family response regulator